MLKWYVHLTVYIKLIKIKVLARNTNLIFLFIPGSLVPMLVTLDYHSPLHFNPYTSCQCLRIKERLASLSCIVSNHPDPHSHWHHEWRWITTGNFRLQKASSPGHRAHLWPHFHSRLHHLSTESISTQEKLPYSWRKSSCLSLNCLHADWSSVNFLSSRDVRLGWSSFSELIMYSPRNGSGCSQHWANLLDKMAWLEQV